MLSAKRKQTEEEEHGPKSFSPGNSQAEYYLDLFMICKSLWELVKYFTGKDIGKFFFKDCQVYLEIMLSLVLGYVSPDEVTQVKKTIEHTLTFLDNLSVSDELMVVSGLIAQISEQLNRT